MLTRPDRLTALQQHIIQLLINMTFIETAKAGASLYFWTGARLPVFSSPLIDNVNVLSPSCQLVKKLFRTRTIKWSLITFLETSSFSFIEIPASPLIANFYLAKLFFLPPIRYSRSTRAPQRCPTVRLNFSLMPRQIGCCK